MFLSSYHHNPIRIKNIARFQLRLSYLEEHEFKHSLHDSRNHVYSCDNNAGFVIQYSFNNIFTIMGIIHSLVVNVILILPWLKFWCLAIKKQVKTGKVSTRQLITFHQFRNSIGHICEDWFSFSFYFVSPCVSLSLCLFSLSVCLFSLSHTQISCWSSGKCLPFLHTFVV